MRIVHRDGSEVLYPETDADVELIQGMVDEGLVEDDASLADQAASMGIERAPSPPNPDPGPEGD